MGFTTGFIGGIALTTSLLYLSLDMHTRNRLRQSALLSHSTHSLTTLVSPSPPIAPPTARTTRAGVTERVKERWNQELEANVRKLQTLNWNAWREDAERGVGRMWERVMVGSREGVVKGQEGMERGVEVVREKIREG